MMKKAALLSAIFCLIVAAVAGAQTVNGVAIKDIDAEYVQIVGMSKLMSLSKVNITIDFGQETKVFSNKEITVRGEDGKQIVFNSMIDALNFMTSNGFEFVQAFAVTTGNQNVYHYLLRKKKR